MNARLSFYSRETTAADYLQMRAPRELWAAVLKQAIDDVLEGPSQFECKQIAWTSQDQFRRDVMFAAQEWFADDADEPRRFVWVCNQLGVDPAAVRREIERRKHAG